MPLCERSRGGPVIPTGEPSDLGISQEGFVRMVVAGEVLGVEWGGGTGECRALARRFRDRGERGVGGEEMIGIWEAE